METINPVLQWLRNNGGFFHQDLVRKKDENGVYGVYTTKPIKSNELLCMIPQKCSIFHDYDPISAKLPDNLKLRLAYIILLEKRKGTDSFFFEAIKLMTTLEEYKQFHPYFLSEEEHENLAQFSPIFRMQQNNLEAATNLTLKAIKEFDPSFTDDQITESLFINNTRTWYGMFLPVMDLFNHSTQKGIVINTDEKRNSYARSKVDYKEGEQVYISYGNKDMLNLAYDYGYYDPTDFPLVLPMMLNFSGSTPISFAIARKCVPFGFKCVLNDTCDNITCGVENYDHVERQKKLICFSNDGISADLYKIFEYFSISNPRDLENDKGERSHTLTLLVDFLQKMYNVKNKDLQRLPNNKSYAYNMLLECLDARFKIIQDCLEWAKEELEAEKANNPVVMN